MEKEKRSTDQNSNNGNCENSNGTRNKNKQKVRGSVLIQAVLLTILLCVGLGILAINCNKWMERTEALSSSNINIEQEEPSEEQTVEKAEKVTGWKRQWKTEQKVLVAVPVESMSLRAAPGFGKEALAELKAGTVMLWDGESSKIDQAEFYKVKLVNSEELVGYVPARYCVPVEFWGDIEELSIVSTGSALYTYEELEEDLDLLCARYPELLTSSVIGSSADGRNLYSVVLGNEEAPVKVMVQAGIHGREYMTTQLIMKMLEYYAYYYENAGYGERSYRELFDRVAFYIVPMSNPDGVTISQLGISHIRDKKLRDIVENSYKTDSRDRYSEAYRLSYEEYQRIWKANARGVDLNNNFDAGWSKMGLKSWTSFENHKGSEAESEPESQALAGFAREKGFDYFLNYHSKGQLIYYDVPGNKPGVSEASLRLAQLLDSKIKYKPVSTKKSTYVNLGGFGDYVQLSLQKPSVTIETGQSDCPLEIEEFPAMWYRNRESWAFLVHTILKEEPREGEGD